MAVTYRVTSTVLLGLITYAITGEIVDSSLITILFAVTATVLFYFNDRAWERSDWGRRGLGNLVKAEPSLKPASLRELEGRK